ncbi:hypothetical protein EDB84DRAFT_1509981 [Lactarius hengduanensis]|nr:hypothetical protein EDB84DRAFT_1509981 [Lactarius hengduanensis]
MPILPKGGSCTNTDSEDKRRPKMTIKFVLLRSPLAALYDPETIIVRQMLSAKPSLSEVLWNFSRYTDRARITLEQNPHFYSNLPADESAYTHTFKHHPFGELSTALKPHDTVYVLVDRPGHVFLETEGEKRRFGNVWMLNGTLIFKNSSGVLEGEQLVRGIRGSWRRHEEPIVFPKCECRARLNPSRLRPIITTPSANPASGVPFDDWAILSHPSSHSINIQIYSAQKPHGCTDLDLPPPPPTSEEPEYQVLYTSINTLNDDILLGIFSHYRPDDEGNRKRQLGWFKLAHVCRRWRRLIYESAFHLDAHILCTEGAPVVDMLPLLPPLPLVINYQSLSMHARDELGISHALRLRNRVRHVDLDILPSNLRKLLVLLDEPFPRLERLSLSSAAWADEDTSLVIPNFLAPNLRHLKLRGVDLSSELQLLSSTISLVTLTLTDIRDSGDFLPKHLITRLRSFRQLEELSIDFSPPVPHISPESDVFDALDTPVTLPKLKCFTFRGVSAYLESLVAQIRAPLLERLSITLFNQTAFALSHLAHFIDITEGLKLPIAKVLFERDAVSVGMGSHRWPNFNGYRSFRLLVMCNGFDPQVHCAAQICSALRPVLSSLGQLALVDGLRDWQNGDNGDAMWHKLLRPFIGAKTLHICNAVRRELASALQVGDAGSDPGLLPSLQELAFDISERYLGNSFTSFIRARQIAGRPVRLSAPQERLPSPVREQRFQLPDHLPIEGHIVYRIRPIRQPRFRLLDHFPMEDPIAYRIRQRRLCSTSSDEQRMTDWSYIRNFLCECGSQVSPVPSKRYLPVPYVPPVRVEQDPPPFRTARPVKTQPPPPKHIRGRIRPSHKGARSAWR